jgi:hypothetical protein
MSDQPDLFPLEVIAALSPRLKWMALYNLETEHLTDSPGTESPETGDEIPCWVCRVKKLNPMHSTYKPREIGRGDNEDDACLDWSKNAGVAPWNQNPF